MARLGSSAVKYLGRVAPTLSPFFETSEVKNESSEALLMSQMNSSIKLETKISTSKVDFFCGKVSDSSSEYMRRGGETSLGGLRLSPDCLWNVNETTHWHTYIPTR